MGGRLLKNYLIPMLKLVKAVQDYSLKTKKSSVVVILLVLSVVGIGCLIFWKFRSYSPNVSVGKSIHQKTKSNPVITPKLITIIPLGSQLSSSFVSNAHREIKRFLPDVELQSITPLPQSAYYAARGRYRADSLIHWMSRRAKPNQVFIGITNVDISTTKGQHADWGVMGLAFRPGAAAVASSHRLKNKSEFWKIAIHELGHTSGLPHCPVKTCFMRDAEGGDPTGEETGFCNSCRSVLLKSGWKL